MPHEDLVLMPEVQARRALAGQSLRLFVLFPVGPFAGRGALRVLRVRTAAGEQAGVELVCGYESYERLDEALEVNTG